MEMDDTPEEKLGDHMYEQAKDRQVVEAYEARRRFVERDPALCNCDQARALARQLEIACSALDAIKSALGTEGTFVTESSRLNVIGSIVSLAEANLERYQ